MASTATQRMNERLQLAEQRAAAGDLAGAMAYTQAAQAYARTGAARQAANRIYNAYAGAALRGYNPSANVPQGTTEPTGSGDTGGGGGGGGDTGPTEEDKYYAALRAQLEEERRQAREGAKAFLNNILTQYGLGSLSGSIEGLVNEWGTNTAVIAERLRQTDQYKTRFKGMLQLQQKGVPDIRNEAEYIALESEYRRVFRENNLSNFLGEAGTQNEYDKIADIVGKFSLSVNEVRDRISDAQRVVADTPEEIRNAFRSYYNVEADALVSYVLDPERASQEINRMANAAIVGGMAQRSGLNFGSSVSEQIAGLRAGTNDLNADAIRPELTNIAQTRDATARLANLEKSTLSDEEVALSELDLNSGAKKKVRGLQSRERARFSGSSAITSGTLNRRGGV